MLIAFKVHSNVAVYICLYRKNIYLEVKIIGQLMGHRLPPGIYHRRRAKEATVSATLATTSGHRQSRLEQWREGGEGEACMRSSHH